MKLLYGAVRQRGRGISGLAALKFSLADSEAIAAQRFALSDRLSFLQRKK
jgi:hypothetical protein